MPRHALKRPSALATGAVLVSALTAVAAPAHAASPTAGKYVALGDSYAAGAGIPSSSAGLCLRSDHNYGHLIAAALASSSYTDVTCSAAKVKAITEPQYQAVLKVNDPQLDAVTADTSLVTLGIGGNDLGTSDVGIVDVIATCVAGAVLNPFGTPCKDHYVQSRWSWSRWTWVRGEDTLAARVDAVAPQLAGALQKIHVRAPAAKVLVVGYPSLLPAAESDCLGRQPITVGDVAYLRGVLGRLNTVLATTARANNAVYVDTAGPTRGHDICSSDRWIEGALPRSPALPFHPNATGERAMASVVLGALGR